MCSIPSAFLWNLLLTDKPAWGGVCNCSNSGLTVGSSGQRMLIFRFRGAFGYTLVSSATTKAVVSTIDNTERRYFSVTKTGSLIVPDFPRNNFMLNLHDSDLQSSWCTQACSTAGLNWVGAPYWAQPAVSPCLPDLHLIPLNLTNIVKYCEGYILDYICQVLLCIPVNSGQREKRRSARNWNG